MAGGDPAIGDVRGVGLALGVEFVSDLASREPDGPRAQAVRDRMRHLGVLVGITGPDRNVLKIRPPLALTEEHVPPLAEAFATAVSDTR